MMMASMCMIMLVCMMMIPFPGVARQHTYHLQVRDRIIHMYYNLEMSPAEIAATFGNRPCTRTVYNVLSCFAIAGYVSEAPAGQRGLLRPGRQCNEAVAAALHNILRGQDQQLYLDEIGAKLAAYPGVGGIWSVMAVSRALHDTGFRLKKVHNRAAEARPIQQAAYRDGCFRSGFSAKHYIFMDEMASDERDVNRPYAWCQAGERSTALIFFIRGVRHTVIAAISCDGVIAIKIIEGAADKDTFHRFFVQEVVPLMHPFPASQSVVVMDNCAIHGKTDIGNVVRSFGAISLFLPPYSPEFNPIEKIFGNVKQWLLRRRNYVNDPLIPAERILREAFGSITPATCEAYIRGWPMYNV